MAEEKKYKVALRNGYTSNPADIRGREETTLYGLSFEDAQSILKNIGTDYIYKHVVYQELITINLKFFSMAYMKEDTKGDNDGK